MPELGASVSIWPVCVWHPRPLARQQDPDPWVAWWSAATLSGQQHLHTLCPDLWIPITREAAHGEGVH